MKTVIRKMLPLMALLALGACESMQDAFRYMDEGPRNYRGGEMQRYWDHSWPGQRRRGWS